MWRRSLPIKEYEKTNIVQKSLLCTAGSWETSTGENGWRGQRGAGCCGGEGCREVAACCHPAVSCLKAFSGVNLLKELEALLVATYFLPSAGSPSLHLSVNWVISAALVSALRHIYPSQLKCFCELLHIYNRNLNTINTCFCTWTKKKVLFVVLRGKGWSVWELHGCWYTEITHSIQSSQVKWAL